jgi:hypothetical protein
MTLVHALSWRYLIRSTPVERLSEPGGGASGSVGRVVLGAEGRYLDLVIVVGAVDAVDDAGSGQVGSGMPGVDERGTERGTTRACC